MFKSILLAVDLNHEASWRRALDAAVRLAEAERAGLHIVTVLPDLHMPLVAGFFPADFMARARKTTEEHLQAFVAEHVPDAVHASHAVLSGGSVHERILEAAETAKADLIVMAAYRPDVKDRLLGSNADRVVNHARQSVLVIKDD